MPQEYPIVPSNLVASRFLVKHTCLTTPPPPFPQLNLINYQLLNSTPLASLMQLSDAECNDAHSKPKPPSPVFHPHGGLTPEAPVIFLGADLGKEGIHQQNSRPGMKLMEHDPPQGPSFFGGTCNKHNTRLKKLY